jgi:hypothetical protein
MTILKPGASGPPGFKFENVGDHVHGTVVKVEEVQQRTMEGELKTWSDGNPMMQCVVTLARDGNHEDLVRVFLKGSKSNPKSGIGSVVDAIERSGADDIEVGGTLDVEHIGVGERSKGKQPPKLYHSAYAPPSEDDE